MMFKEGRTRPNREVRERDADVERKMNKVSLVTLWVDPDEHQIVSYEFRNIDMDFLPGLADSPRRMTGEHGNGTAVSRRLAAALVGDRLRHDAATGQVSGRYSSEYHDYRLATVETHIRR